MWSRLLVYLALAVGMTWPSAWAPVAAVPGAPRTDLWDSLWSLWFVYDRVTTGQPLTRVDGLLDHPDGGSLWAADPLNALLALPLIPLVGVAAAWTILVLVHLTVAGLAGHALGERVGGGRAGAGWIGGVAVATAPMLASQVHNGASEAVGGGWVVLAVVALWDLRVRPGMRAGVIAGLALGVATLAHWYAGVMGFVVWAVALGEGALRRRPLRAWLWGWLGAGALGIALAAPVAVTAARASTAPDNVVGIKNPRELATLRRTIGPADPVGFVAPGDFRSPDFRQLSRYQEQYVHNTWLGWVVLVGAVAALVRREPGRSAGPSGAGGRAPGGGDDRGGRVVLAVSAVLLAALSLGPVLAREGAPVILPGRRGIPLPFFLVEGLPGFSGLSLTYRLAWGAVVCLAGLAARGLAGRAWPAWVLLLALESRGWSSGADLPGHTDGTPPAPLVALAEAPPGAVMNWPVVGGRPYLYEQTLHGHPLAATLNFPNNAASRRVWKAAMGALGDPEALRRAAGGRAKQEGVRYLVLHVDPTAEPDEHDAAARAMAEAFPTLADDGTIRVVALY